MKKITCNCSDMKVKAEFLKVLQKVDLKRPLMIPPAFLKHLEEESSEVVILEGPSGGLWNIKLNRIDDGMYLEHGWETFLTDHSLSAGDLLVFSYKGHLHFTVTIFDRRACWREDSFTVKPSQESSNTHEVKRRGRPPETLERAKHGENRKALLDLNHPSQPSETHQTRGLLKQKQPDQLPSSKGKRVRVSKPIEVNQIARRPAKEAVAEFTSRLPFFVIELQTHNVNMPFYVNVPSWFSRSYLPKKETKIVLQDAKENSWIVNHRKFTSRDTLYGGWAKFCQENNLKKGDYCVFELVGELQLRVHIFPVH